MNRICSIALIIVFAIVASPALADDATGTWKWTSVLDQGIEMPWPEENRLVITSDLMTMVYPTERRGWKYTIDPSKDPKEMDWFPEEDPGQRILGLEQPHAEPRGRRGQLGEIHLDAMAVRRGDVPAKVERPGRHRTRLGVAVFRQASFLVVIALRQHPAVLGQHLVTESVRPADLVRERGREVASVGHGEVGVGEQADGLEFRGQVEHQPLVLAQPLPQSCKGMGACAHASQRVGRHATKIAK